MVGKIAPVYLHTCSTYLILSKVDLSGTAYIDIRPTDDPEALYANTINLLQQLAQEETPRKLEEHETQILVNFLRETLLLYHIVHAYNKDEQAVEKLKDKIYQFAGARKVQKEFWALDDDFRIFNVPYILLVAPQGEYPNYHIRYYPTQKDIYRLTSN